MNYNKYDYQDDYHNPTAEMLNSDDQNDNQEKDSNIDWVLFENEFYDQLYEIIDHHKKIDSRFERMYIKDICKPKKMTKHAYKDIAIANLAVEITDYINSMIKYYIDTVLKYYESFDQFEESEEYKNNKLDKFILNNINYDKINYKQIYYNIFRFLQKKNLITSKERFLNF